MTEQIKFYSAVRGVACIFRGVRTVENVRGAPNARADEGSGDMPPPPPPPTPTKKFLGLGNAIYAISHVFQGTVS